MVANGDSAEASDARAVNVSTSAMAGSQREVKCRCSGVPKIAARISAGFTDHETTTSVDCNDASHSMQPPLAHQPLPHRQIIFLVTASSSGTSLSCSADKDRCPILSTPAQPPHVGRAVPNYPSQLTTLSSHRILQHVASQRQRSEHGGSR
ncbi:hypothetical protein CC78DRAFT_548232 [Lojkania enalia]|uniref:Uncharacterized protein n=1 Tax=Lojkania enalia TaxID=147567 RepID=A0A9P4MZI9_9PLEO|nr:hypothetical protein CC78DRAFT_548232 [Didymosphaeria enalia]